MASSKPQIDGDFTLNHYILLPQENTADSGDAPVSGSVVPFSIGVKPLNLRRTLITGSL